VAAVVVAAGDPMARPEGDVVGYRLDVGSVFQLAPAGTTVPAFESVPTVTVVVIGEVGQAGSEPSIKAALVPPEGALGNAQAAEQTVKASALGAPARVTARTDTLEKARGFMDS